MTAPQTPKYGPPYQAPSGTPPDDPDKGQDFWAVVPSVAVPAPWNGNPGAPSFNSDPPGQESDSGGGDSSSIPECWGISMNMASVRASISTMLSEVQSAVSAYGDLRNAVWADKDNIFGQNATVEDPGATGGPQVVAGGGGANAEQNTTAISPMRGQAQEFASHIVPAQEKALESVANALELVGQFIAAVDRSGQTYGRADRKSKFPPPPSSSVKG